MASSTRFFTSYILKVTLLRATSDFICAQISLIGFNSKCPTGSCNSSMLFLDSKQYSAVSSSSFYFLTIGTNSRFCSNIGLVSFFLKWIPFSVYHSWIPASFWPFTVLSYTWIVASVIDDQQADFMEQILRYRWPADNNRLIRQATIIHKIFETNPSSPVK